MLATLIISAAVAVPLLVLAIFLFNGKGAFLIAGFNTMAPEKQKTYNVRALCRAVALLLVAISTVIMIMPIAIYLEIEWLFYTTIASTIVLPIVFAIYANTGNRFRK